jgi:erythronate-4-phosphate dehydrogenase
MKIVADSHLPFVQDYFGIYGELVLIPGRTITRSDVKDADMLLVRSITQVNQSLLYGTTVKFVGSVTAGADHLDTNWLNEAGIIWSVAEGFNAPPVADYIICVIAALQKNKLLKNETFKTAIIGVGNVGKLVLKRLQALNVEVLLCDPVRAECEPGFISHPLDTLSDLDLILLHVPLIKGGAYSTHHMINRAFLQRQRPGCVLLNASRGAVIDSSALLECGEHLHWCFDVWEHEPKIDKKILERAVIATPHIAGYSIQSKIRGIDIVYRVAVEKGMIEPQPISPILVPHNRLTFEGGHCQWQDVVLNIFDPLLMTEKMKHVLLPEKDYAPLFDQMRNQFNDRYEFEYIRINQEAVLSSDSNKLAALGVRSFLA